jgi:hypothetical protein
MLAPPTSSTHRSIARVAVLRRKDRHPGLDMRTEASWAGCPSPKLADLLPRARSTDVVALSGSGRDLRRIPMGAETGDVTGAKDKNYNLIWFTEACLSNALRLEIYIEDATRDGDEELAEFFRKAQADSQKGAEQGKKMLRDRL